MESRNESDVQVVLKLVNGTEPSVKLGPNTRVAVTIISADFVCFIPTGELFTNFILLLLLLLLLLHTPIQRCKRSDEYINKSRKRTEQNN